MAKRAAKRPVRRAGKRTRPAVRKAAGKRSAKRQKRAVTARSAGGKKAKAASRARPAKRKAAPKRTATRKRKATAPRRATPPPAASRLNRARRTLDDGSIQTPPSSLDMERHGSAARSGRAEMLDNQRKHGKMNAVTAGDVDVDAEDAYFTGEEAPGGDNPTPDQDIVDDIGKALGVEYQDDEELQASDKVAKRDKHRWELDPASSEDYKGRK